MQHSTGRFSLLILQIGSKNRKQVVEERIGDRPSADQTYVWGARFVDDLICRNEWGIRIYALQDANFNVVALVEEFGTLLERFHYDPYGKLRVLKPDFTPHTDPGINGSAYKWSYFFTGRELDYESGFQLNRNRYYHSGLGRWINRDPIGYADGYNLYAAYFVPDGVDPEGTDFIAVADRMVGSTAYLLYHYSLQHWKCNCKAAFKGKIFYTDGYSVSAIKAKCPGAKKIASVELLARTGWEVRVKRQKYWWSKSANSWAVKDVWISEIVYSDSSDAIMPIVEDIAPIINGKWRRIINYAKTYRWAEQQGFAKGPTFTQWPRSMYKSGQTNSNTFVRATVKGAGLAMVEMDGSHPGAMTPSQNTDDSVTGGTLVFFAGHKPYEK